MSSTVDWLSPISSLAGYSSGAFSPPASQIYTRVVRCHTQSTLRDPTPKLTGVTERDVLLLAIGVGMVVVGTAGLLGFVGRVLGLAFVVVGISGVFVVLLRYI